MAECPTEAAPYRAEFTRYLTRNVAYLLTLVQETAAVPDDLCNQTLHTLSYALQTPAAWPVTRKLLFALAPKLEQACLRDEWIPYLQTGVAQAQAAHDSFTAGAATFAAAGDTENEARALNRLAFLARLYPAAGDPALLAQRALLLLSPEDPECAATYVALGWHSYDRRDWQSAARYFEDALAIAQQQGNLRQIARRLRDLASARQMQEQYEAALRSYEEAITRFALINDAYDQAVAQMNLGVVHLALNDASQALDRFALSEPIFKRVQDQLHLAMLYNNRGIALRMLGRWHEAEQAFLCSIALNEQVGNPIELLNVTDELAMTYFQQGKVEPAVLYLRKALDQLPALQETAAYTYWHEKITAHWLAVSTAAT
jgi:tetratricopeptide (TPR) repeat protein